MKKSKEQKRKEADERQQFYNQLTKEEKLERINKKSGNSTKEKRKLNI